MTVTRDTIRDLWSLSEAGEASEDSRRLVDSFLADDRELAQELRGGVSPLAAPLPTLPPDHQARTLGLIKRRLAKRSPFRIVALALTGLSVLRFMQQATFVNAPVEPIALAIAATLLWIAYGWHTRYLQGKGLTGRGKQIEQAEG